MRQRDKKWNEQGIDPRGSILGSEIEFSDVTVAELDAALAVEMETYEERDSIVREHIDDDTTKRALQALERPERFNGEHDVARRWLRDTGSHAGLFKRASG